MKLEIVAGTRTIGAVRADSGVGVREIRCGFVDNQAINQFTEERMSGRPEIDLRIKTNVLRMLLMALALLSLFLGHSVAKAQVLYGTLAGNVTPSNRKIPPNIPPAVHGFYRAPLDGKRVDIVYFQLFDGIFGSSKEEARSEVCIALDLFPGWAPEREELLMPPREVALEGGFGLQEAQDSWLA